MYFFLLKSIKFKQIYQAWTLKTKFKPKKLFAGNQGNLEVDLIYEKHSKGA